jgi:F-type H+-transporting ATPase subunit alpha
MENKYPDVLAEFKKGQLNDESLNKMVELAKEIATHYK